MRISTDERASDYSLLTTKAIDDIVGRGLAANFWDNAHKPRLYKNLLRRLQQSCYLGPGPDYKALSSRQRLLAEYEKDGLVLFLGAGVSIGSGIPNWVTLSQRILGRAGLAVPPSDRPPIEELLERFDRVYAKLNDRREFTRLLYECLYQCVEAKALLEDFPRKRSELLTPASREKLRQLLCALRKNSTLTAVGELLIDQETKKNGWRRNPRIHAVLTVNTDNLVELYCQARTSGHRLLTMVDRSSVGDHPNAIPVYHLHGTLDARGEHCSRPECDYWMSDYSLLPDLVFITSEYKRTIANSASFVNHTPQSYLQRLNVLFIGTSLDDPNICRWLKTSYEERLQHRTKYLREYYRGKYNHAEREAEWESIRHFWLRKPENDEDRREIECEKRKLGVQVVWCEDHGLECLSALKKEGVGDDFGRQAHGQSGRWFEFLRSTHDSLGCWCATY